MEQEKSLMKTQMTAPMIQKAFETLDGMKKLAEEFLDSQIIPVHFYEKGADGKPDLKKGQVSKVVAVWIKGDQLGLHPMTSLQEIVPVNGLLSIKGDGAKALILSSGKIKSGSWKEESKGSVADGDFEVTITATRYDTDETLSRSFSVALAKRAGLWVDQAMLQKQDGWKYKHSPWHKYPDRMIKYRALGFLARDLFPDVMNGTYTMEEAQDFPQDQSVTIDARDAEIIIPDKEFNEERSRSLTSKAAEKIDKANSSGLKTTDRDEVPHKKEDIRKYPLTEREAVKAETCEVMLNGTPGEIVVYSEDELKEMSLDDLHDLIEKDSLMIKVRDFDPGKNTNKKLRFIILAKYAGELALMLPDENREEEPGMAEGYPDDMPSADEHFEKAETEAEVEAETETEENKFNIEVPETVEGKRSFDGVKSLFEDISNMAGIDNHRFEQLISTKLPQFQKYRTKEDFCYKATKDEINTLLNSI